MRTASGKKRKTGSALGISGSGEMQTKQSVYDRRKYRVKNVEGAKQISANYLKDIDLDNAIEFGLPEVDDRYHIWRVPLKGRDGHKVGEVVIDAHTSLIQQKRRRKSRS